MSVDRLLVATAGLYAIPGLALTFAPEEVLLGLGALPTPAFGWIGQLLGAVLIGMALLNWYLRRSAMGGIYGRPLLLANLTPLTIAFFATLRLWAGAGTMLYAVATAILGVFTVAYGGRLFRTPAAVGAPPESGVSSA